MFSGLNIYGISQDIVGSQGDEAKEGREAAGKALAPNSSENYCFFLPFLPIPLLHSLSQHPSVVSLPLPFGSGPFGVPLGHPLLLWVSQHQPGK